MECAPKNKKLQFALLLYVFLLLFFLIVNFFQNSDSSLVPFALKYFKKIDLETGRYYFWERLVPSTLYRVGQICLLAYLIKSAYRPNFVKSFFARLEKSQVKLTFFKILFLFIFLFFLKIPFDIFIGFGLKKYFALTKASFLVWLFRYLGSSLLEILIISGAGFILVVVIKRVKKYIFFIPMVVFGMSLLYLITYPRLITPLFYDEVKIENPILSEEINNLAVKAEIDSSQIKFLNTSQDSLMVNAYFIGFGPFRRIILYDTLLEKFSVKEILAILAHEMGHFKEEHILVGLSLACLGSFLGLLLIDFMSLFIFNFRLRELVIKEKFFHIIFILILTFFLIKPIKNMVSRNIETRADKFSLEITSEPETFINMKVKLALQNKSNIAPNPVYAWFFYTHPPILERIRYAEEFYKK